jgi:single-strand DNA-binding protein
MSLNKAMIIGNLGRDPEMRYTPSGQAVTQFTVAVNRNYKDQAGEWQEETEWFRVVVWGQQAERTAEYLRKGSKVFVEGRMQTRQWEGQDGQKRYTTELIADRVQNLERRNRDDAGDPGFQPRAGDRPSGDRAPAAQPSSGGPADAGSEDGPDPGQDRGPTGKGSAAPSGGLDDTDIDDLPF